MTAARHCTNASMLYCGIGLLGMGLMSALLPRGCLQSSVNHSNPWTPLVMAAAQPTWLEMLYYERSLLAALVLVALCIYATLTSPGPAIATSSNHNTFGNAVP
jgi:uncharacterized membrane protein YoaK (UPF0700 family)